MLRKEGKGNMKKYAIYFSPTNRTKKVVSCIANEFGEYTTIDLCRTNDRYEYTFSEDDVCIIGVPVYGGRVPGVAIERIKQFTGNQTKVIIVASYGNRAYEDALKELADTLTSKGFVCVGAIAAITEHNIVHQFATGRPDMNDIQQLQTYAKQLKEKLANPYEISTVTLPGNYPYKEFIGGAFKPLTDSTCISCGICARVCPVAAIPTNKPSTTNYCTCINCMRCIEVCPEDARGLDSVLLEQLGKRLEPVCSDRKNNELFI